MGLVLAGIAVALVVLLARVSPVSAVLAVCAVGGLHAHGVVRLPAPEVVDRAAAQVRAVQDRSVQRLVCRQVVQQASEDDLERLEAACAPAR